MLANTFYIMSIVALSLQILLLIAVVVLLVIVVKKLNHIYAEITAQIENVKQTVKHPRELAQTVGQAVASTVFEQISQFIASRKKKHE